VLMNLSDILKALKDVSLSAAIRPDEKQKVLNFCTRLAHMTDKDDGYSKLLADTITCLHGIRNAPREQTEPAKRLTDRLGLAVNLIKKEGAAIAKAQAEKTAAIAREAAEKKVVIVTAKSIHDQTEIIKSFGASAVADVTGMPMRILKGADKDLVKICVKLQVIPMLNSNQELSEVEITAVSTVMEMLQYVSRDIVKDVPKLLMESKVLLDKVITSLNTKEKVFNKNTDDTYDLVKIRSQLESANSLITAVKTLHHNNTAAETPSSTSAKKSWFPSMSQANATPP
jgi:hypothetical protein